MADAKPLDVEREIDWLFQMPLDRFTGARNDAVRRARSSGDPAAAERIKKISRPTVSAWAVNQLHWKDGERFRRLIEAGDRFRAEQLAALRGRESPDLAEAARERRKAVSQALARIEGILEASGSPASPATRARVATTLDAISAYGSAAPREAFGRLSRDLEPPGFEALLSLAEVEPAAHAVKAPPEARARRDATDKKAAAEAARWEEARAAVARLERESASQRRQADRAADAAATAAARADALRREADEIERRLEEARERARRAGEAAESARAAAEKQGAMAAAAEKELERARKELEKLRSGRR